MAQGSIREGLALLRNPNFARLFTAYLITFTGNAMAPIAIAFGVLELTGSTRDSAIVIAAPIVAQIMILLVGGALADRTSRQKMMVRAECVAAASQMTIAVLFLTGTATVPLLACFMFINGTAMAFYAPASTGFIPQVVEREKLQPANAILGTARSSATTIGAALAGILVALFGAGVTLAIDAISFAISAFLLVGITARHQESGGTDSIVAELVLGWKEFISHQWLWAMVLQFTIMVAAFEATFGLLGPAIMRNEMGGAADWGLVMAGMGIGTITGGFIAMLLKPGRPMLLAALTCFFFMGTPAALAYLMPLPLIITAAVIGGIAGQVFFVLWQTTLQREIPLQMLSRVAAYDHLGSIALAPLGVVIGGFLFESIGGQTTLLIATAAIFVPTLLVLLVPGIWRLKAPADAYT